MTRILTIVRMRVYWKKMVDIGDKPVVIFAENRLFPSPLERGVSWTKTQTGASVISAGVRRRAPAAKDDAGARRRCTRRWRLSAA